MIIVIGNNFNKNKILIEKLKNMGLKEIKLSTTMSYNENLKDRYNYVKEDEIPKGRMSYFRIHKDGSKTFLDGKKLKKCDFIMLNPWEFYKIAGRNGKLKLNVIYIADEDNEKTDSYCEFEEMGLSGSLEEFYPNVMRIYDLSIKNEKDVDKFIKEQNNLKNWY